MVMPRDLSCRQRAYETDTQLLPIARRVGHYHGLVPMKQPAPALIANSKHQQRTSGERFSDIRRTQGPDMGPL